MKTKTLSIVTLACTAAILAAPKASAQTQAQDKKKPNILIIWGDDVGMWNISAYHRGMMGGSTPNIDRIGKESLIFMDHYAQASCTAGRASFITGQYPLRTGLSTVGLPGAKEGIQDRDPHPGDDAQGAGICHRPVRQEPPRGPRLATSLAPMTPMG